MEKAARLERGEELLAQLPRDRLRAVDDALDARQVDAGKPLAGIKFEEVLVAEIRRTAGGGKNRPVNEQRFPDENLP